MKVVPTGASAPAEKYKAPDWALVKRLCERLGGIEGAVPKTIAEAVEAMAVTESIIARAVAAFATENPAEDAFVAFRGLPQAEQEAVWRGCFFSRGQWPGGPLGRLMRRAMLPGVVKLEADVFGKHGMSPGLVLLAEMDPQRRARMVNRTFGPSSYEVARRKGRRLRRRAPMKQVHIGRRCGARTRGAGRPRGASTRSSAASGDGPDGGDPPSEAPSTGSLPVFLCHGRRRRGGRS